MSELKPCPFCGGKAKYESILHVEPILDANGAYIGADDDYYEYVHCTECQVMTDNYENEGEAIEAWNRRAEQ